MYVSTHYRMGTTMEALRPPEPTEAMTEYE